MTKEFPKSRICVIDVLSAIEAGIKEAVSFSKKFNISLQTPDGKKVLLSYCLKEIELLYKNTKSSYPKVICVSTKYTNKKIQNFVNNHLNKIMNKFYFPFCGNYDLDSPELEIAAELSLERPKKTKTFFNIKTKLNIKG
jgi:hypothetical protein